MRRKKNIESMARPNMRTLIPSGFVGEMEIVIPDAVVAKMKECAITRQLSVTHIGFYPHAKDHYRERENGAEQYVFIYCESGSGTVICNGEAMHIGKNHFVILPPNVYHCYYADEKDPWTIYWLHFIGTNAVLFDSIVGKDIEITESVTSRILDRLNLFAEMYRNLEKGFSLDCLEYTSCCLTHFLGTLKYIMPYREIKSIKSIDTIQKCIIYMKDNLGSKVTLSDIADVAGYSVPHITALFKKEMKYSPMEYYSRLKIERACTYLLNSSLKIKEIAFKLNYYDQFHFSKMFIKEMGVKPTEYRLKKGLV
jgi:AraC-like DNA-binding protein/mannose-6-phosphate isomerase-like protein (cupin superfamily)